MTETFEDLLEKYAIYRGALDVYENYDGTVTKAVKKGHEATLKSLRSLERQLGKAFRLEKKMWSSSHEEMPPG